MITLKIEDEVRRFWSLKGERGLWEGHWEDAAKFCLPAKYQMLLGTPGSKVATEIYDSTAIQSVQIFAAGLHGYLTNPASLWFSLGIQNEKVAKSYEVQDWLHACQRIIFDVLNRSNFNSQIHEGYIDFSVFGTMALYEEEDIKDYVRFYTRPISEIFLVENYAERVDTIFRSFILTARQAYQRWGETAGQKVAGKLNSKSMDEMMDFLHIVIPREERDNRKRDKFNKPYASLYIEPSSNYLISEGGYEEFPFFCPRYTKVSTSSYGYSPAMIALPSIKSVNSMKKTMFKVGQRIAEPWIILPDDGFLLPFRQTPAAINFRRAGLQDKIDVFEVKGNLPFNLELLNAERADIKAAFFVDLFLMLAQLDKTMTAREVAERAAEKMLILGPVLGRLMDELLDPIIERTFNILMRSRALPPPPAILQGQEYHIEYISPLARAQKMAEAKAITEMVSIVTEMSNKLPQVLDLVDADKAGREFAKIYNTEHILRSDEEIEAIRQQRIQQQQVQAALDQAGQGAGAIKAIAEAGRSAQGGK